MTKILLPVVCAGALGIVYMAPAVTAPTATTLIAKAPRVAAPVITNSTIPVPAVTAPVEREYVQPASEPWMNEKITAPTEQLPLDEALSALARSASLNAFVDATDLLTDLSILPYDQRPKDFFEMNYGGRINVIHNTLSQAQMTKARVGHNTFVFWHQPDTNRILNLIVARHRELDAQFPPDANYSDVYRVSRDASGAQLPDENSEGGLAKIKAYFERTQGWPAAPQTLEDMQRSAQGSAQAVNVSQLPADVRQLLQAELIRRIRSERVTPLPEWFDIASWNDARVGIVAEDANYFRPDGLVLGRAQARVLRVFFPNRRQSFLVGIPAWANPRFPRVDSVELPAYLSEGAQLANFEIGDAKAEATPAAPLPLVNFSSDARTQKQVKFAAKRQDLRALVADLQTQSGIALSVSDEVAPGAQVLAISGGMEAREALEAIERLYQAVWVPSEGGYALQPQNMSELQKQMSRLGDHFSSAFDSINLKQRHLMGQRVAEEISVGLDPNALQSAQGAPFSQLSDEVQSHVMQLFRDDKARELVEMQRRFQAVEPYFGNFEVQLNRASPNAQPFFVSENYRLVESANVGTDSTLRAFAPDGRTITRLYPSFSVAPPNELDATREKTRLASEARLAQTDPKGYQMLLEAKQARQGQAP